MQPCNLIKGFIQKSEQPILKSHESSLLYNYYYINKRNNSPPSFWSFTATVPHCHCIEKIQDILQNFFWKSKLQQMQHKCFNEIIASNLTCTPATTWGPCPASHLYRSASESRRHQAEGRFQKLQLLLLHIRPVTPCSPSCPSAYGRTLYSCSLLSSPALCVSSAAQAHCSSTDSLSTCTF